MMMMMMMMMMTLVSDPPTRRIQLYNLHFHMSFSRVSEGQRYLARLKQLSTTPLKPTNQGQTEAYASWKRYVKVRWISILSEIVTL